MEVCLCCEWSYTFSGPSAAVTIFDEEEIVSGDLVNVELDLEVFKMMHQAAGLWVDDLTKVIISLYDNY